MPECNESFEKHAPQARSGNSGQSALPCGDGRSPALEPRAQNPYVVLAVCGFLFLAVVIVFGQTVRHDFVNYDDNQYVYENPQVDHGLTAQGIFWAFTTIDANNWHPLTWLSHMMDCQLYGLHAGGHHLTNVLLHAATAILLFLVLRRMTGDLWPSAFVAAVFAIHPLRVESVAWVAERKDVLSGLFFMLTLWAYVEYVRHPFSIKRYLSVIVLFALGLMAKPMLVTLPFVLLLLDYWPLGRMTLPITGDDGNKSWGDSNTGAQEAPTQLLPEQIGEPIQLSPHQSFSFSRRLIIEKIPLLLLTAISCVATFLAQGNAVAPMEIVPLPTRIANALISYVAYIGQSFYPADLAVLYPYPTTGLMIWKAVVALLVLLGISLGAMACWRRNPYLLVGWLWYLVMLMPVIGLVQVGVQAMANRYTYLPQIGLSIALAWGIIYIARSWPYRRWVCGVASALVVAVLMGCTWRQTTFWCNSETLWTHTLACTSQNYLAHNNLGNVLLDTDRVQEAMEHFRQALQLKPDYSSAHNNLGLVLAKTGRPQEAIEHYQQALRFRPYFVEAHYNLGLALANAGQLPEAIKHYQQALLLNPDYSEAHYNLGVALAETGRLQEAIEHYNTALKLNPDYSEAHNNLGVALAETGRLPGAIDHFQKGLQLEPKDANAHHNLALALANVGRHQEAIEHYEQALRLKSDYPEAQYNLGLSLANVGQLQEAMEHYEKALRLKSNYPEAHYRLGLALASLARSQEAIEHYEQALRLKPDMAEVHNELGMALNAKGRHQGAIEHFQQAVRINPDYLVAYKNLAFTYIQTNQLNEAVAAAQKAVKLARSSNQMEIAKQIEDWLDSYRDNQADLPSAEPSSKSDTEKP
jgi:protein O-mannosyl-transferase